MFSPSRGLDSFDQYLQDVEKYPLIQDPREERELARRAREGDKEAAERLVTANLRFVISYVKKYQGRGLGLAELVCIGNEGLLKAVKKFDPDKGVKFISYAVWWIRQTVITSYSIHYTKLYDCWVSSVSVRLSRARLEFWLSGMRTERVCSASAWSTVWRINHTA